MSQVLALHGLRKVSRFRGNSGLMAKVEPSLMTHMRHQRLRIAAAQN
jgi:hypothetical protein